MGNQSLLLNESYVNGSISLETPSVGHVEGFQSAASEYFKYV